jgi:hypothetical protein
MPTCGEMPTGVVKRGFEGAKRATLVETWTDNAASRPEFCRGGLSALYHGYGY